MIGRMLVIIAIWAFMFGALRLLWRACRKPVRITRPDQHEVGQRVPETALDLRRVLRQVDAQKAQTVRKGTLSTRGLGRDLAAGHTEVVVRGRSSSTGCLYGSRISRKSVMKIGICTTSGKHPASGLILFSW